MPWGSGSYSKGNAATGGWTGDASLGIGIEAGRHDTQDNDFATGINQCLNKDGSNAATGNLNIGANRVTNIGAATARTDAAQTAQVQDGSPLWGGTSGGTSTAYTITLSPAITAYATGQVFRWIANATVTGAATINVNSVGAKALQRQGTALVGNEFKTGDVVEMVYDGTQFQITNLAEAPLFVDRTNNRLGIGTTAPTSVVTVIGNPLLAPNTSNTAGDTYYEARVTGTADGSPNSIRVGVDGASLAGVAYIDARNVGVSAATPLTFRNNGTERMRLTSIGQVLFGKTSAVTSGTGSYFDPSVAGYPAILVNCKTWSGNLLALQNHYNGTYVGGINYSDTATSFPTSSDYRLKENIVDIDNALGRVGQLKPCRFNFIIKPDETIDGFIAHEVQTIVPNAVEGEKDAVNEDGSIKVQSLDNSKLVPLLTAAIQELNAKVESLEARIAALEA